MKIREVCVVDRYRPDRVHKRVDYIQFIYKNTIYPEALENFLLPIAIFGRDGTVAVANDMFRKLAGITKGDIEKGEVNIFTCLEEKHAGLSEAAYIAFDGKENVYKGCGSLIHTKGGKVEEYQLNRHPNAIFFPMARDEGGISLAGILLDESKTDE